MSNQQKLRAAVVVGRFNPPTLGHYAILDQVKKFIRTHPRLDLEVTPICVIVQGKKTSKDKLKNPLTGNERQSFMQGSGRADGVKFLISTSAFAAFEDVRAAGFEPIVIAAGEDRAEEYLELLDRSFTTEDGGRIKRYAIKLPRNKNSQFDNLDADEKLEALNTLLGCVDDKFPVEMISGTLARHAVHASSFDKFCILTGLTEKPKLARLLFTKIKTALSVKAP